MDQFFQGLSKMFMVFWIVAGSVQADYDGKLTCESIEHYKIYTNDPRFVPFCSDASKGCFIRQQLDKLPETHSLRNELDTQLENHLNFNFGLCEVAIMTFEPKLYSEQFKR